MLFPYRRRLHRLLALLALLALVAPSACSLGGADPNEPPVTPVPGTDATLSFVDQGTLMLTPGQTVDVDVVAKPAAHYEVSFYLVGAALDGSLFPATTITGSDGRASVTLRAPNGATSFVLRATITDGPSADLQVAVSDQGFGSLSIFPSYAGSRDPNEWVAKVVSGTNCAALAATLPEDPPGALSATATPGSPLVIEVAPVGPNLAIAVRGGHYMWGCSDEPNLVANETTEVDVHIVDKPIDLSDVMLDVMLDFAPEVEPWLSLVQGVSERMVSAAIPPEGTEAATLLGTMQALSPDPVAFAEASSKGHWLEVVQAHFDATELSLGDAMHAWITAGLEAAPAQIRGQIRSLPDAPGSAAFTLSHVQGVTPPAGGVPAEYLMTLTVDPDDTVRLGGNLFWLASRHLGAAADEAVAALATGASNVAEALAQQAQCVELGVGLGGLEGCDQACMGALCTAALGILWDTAASLSANAGMVGGITMQTAGGAEFDDYAGLTGFEGTWLGSVSDGLADVGIEGAAKAQQSEGGQAP